MKLIDKDALIRNLCVNTKYGTYSECTDGSEVTFTSREIDRIIDEQPIISIISENNPLTLDEVKELKEGDVVWLKYINGNYPQPIQFAEISGEFLTYYTFGNELLCNRFFSGINKVCEIYRNKPEEEQK